LFQSPLLEHRRSIFPSFIVSITPIGTSKNHFFLFHCSNHPYWNIGEAIFPLSLFQSRLLEHRRCNFSSFIVLITPIGTSQMQFFHLSLFQSRLLEHRRSDFSSFIVPITPIGTSQMQFFPFSLFQTRLLEHYKSNPFPIIIVLTKSAL